MEEQAEPLSLDVVVEPAQPTEANTPGPDEAPDVTPEIATGMVSAVHSATWLVLAGETKPLPDAIAAAAGADLASLAKRVPWLGKIISAGGILGDLDGLTALGVYEHRLWAEMTAKQEGQEGKDGAKPAKPAKTPRGLLAWFQRRRDGESRGGLPPSMGGADAGGGARAGGAAVPGGQDAIPS
jgi:hypothetical protein